MSVMGKAIYVEGLSLEQLKLSWMEVSREAYSNSGGVYNVTLGDVHGRC